MMENIENRPYSLRTVVIEGHEEGLIECYSNTEADSMREWPVFTRDQVTGLMENTVRAHFQTFWIDELQNYAVVEGYGNSLPAKFDIAPHMAGVLEDEEVDAYDGGSGYFISLAEKRTIEVDGEKFDTFSFDQIDYYYCAPTEPTAAARR